MNFESDWFLELVCFSQLCVKVIIVYWHDLRSKRLFAMLSYHCKRNDIQHTLHVFVWERKVVLRLKPFGERKEEILTCKSYLPADVPVKCKKGKETHVR